MTARMTGETFLPESELVPGLSINEFVLTALSKDFVRDINAGRLLASDICMELSDEAQHKLHRVIGNGEAGPGEIIAPLLRVTDDFRDQDVMIHTGKGSAWEKHAIWAIDDVTNVPITETDPGVKVDINPRSVSVFPLDDYNKMIKPPAGIRRPKGHAGSFRFALGLSLFDPLYQHNLQPIERAHRRFVLVWDPESFRRQQ